MNVRQDSWEAKYFPQFDRISVLSMHHLGNPYFSLQPTALLFLLILWNYPQLNRSSEACSQPSQISKTELFAEIINGF